MNEHSEPRVRQGMDYGESEDVQEVHAAIQREKLEPRVGLEPLSLWQQHRRVGAAAARAAATIALIAVESPDEVAFAQVLLREFPHPHYGGTT